VQGTALGIRDLALILGKRCCGRYKQCEVIEDYDARCEISMRHSLDGKTTSPQCEARTAFTLVELLVVIAIVALLMVILLPALSGARRQAKATACLTHLRTIGQGIVLYANHNNDVLVPGRLPKIDDENWRVKITGGIKYRPTFLAMMAGQLGIPPFEEPLPSKTETDKGGQPGDRQNYASDVFLCPEVSHWVDERNGAYGYNYQFLGNSRLRDETRMTSYKNWPVKYSSIRSPHECVAVADCMGTAASFKPRDRRDYEDNEFRDSASGRTLEAYGNEGFNLDPPRVDPDHGEMASLKHDHAARTALHPRHKDRGSVLWVDGHASGETLKTLGYDVDEEGVVTFEGDNKKFSVHHLDEAWVETR